MAKGDEVYAQHPKLGPVAVQVLSHGADGFTGRCAAGRQHQLGYDTVLGHKKRIAQNYDVVDQGADGAILQDDRGGRRFVRHTGAADAGQDAAPSASQPTPPKGGGGAENRDDPLLDRRDMLKATSADATPAQLEAGNYVKEKRSFQGLPVSIENAAGTMRRGRDAGGHEWAVKMAHSYGYIRGTLGVDGDHFDVLLGPDQDAGTAYLFTLRAPPDFTKDDEQKALLGFPSEAAARQAFADMYDNPRFLGAVHAMPMERFKALVMTTREKPRFLKASENMPPNITGNITEPKLGLFIKGGLIANRAGLALKDVTDRGGHHTKRWTKTGQDTPGERKKAAPMQHGKLALFRHGDVQGQGRIVGSGKDGVTIHDGQREHQVRHADLVGPAPEPKAPSAASKSTNEAADGPDSGSTGNVPDDTSGKQSGHGGTSGGDGPIPPDKFSAHDFAAQHNDPSVTPDDVLKAFPPDTKAKLDAVNEKLKTVGQTIDRYRKDGVYTPERQELHDKIVQQILSPDRIKAATPAEGQQPTFTILGGRGGSGKSWFEGNVFHPEQAIVLDADAIKQMLPEYQGWNAAEVHEESGDIFDRLTEDAKDLGLNLVHDATMKTAKKAVALVQTFKASSYRTEAHYMYLPPQEAAKRAVSRFLGPTKRFVPPGIVLGNTTNEGSFDQVKGLVDTWSFHDNNVAKGQPPKLISESANGTDRGKPRLHGLPAAQSEQPEQKVTADAKDDRRAQRGKGGDFAKALPSGRSGGVKPRLFLKAIIPGGAAGDLFASTVTVKDHTTKHGVHVPTHTAMVHKHAPVTPAPADDRMRRLAALQNRPTRHEAVVHHPDGRKHLLAYVEGKSGSQLRRALLDHADHLQRATAAGSMLQATPEGKDRIRLHTAMDSRGHVSWSGRTQREAIMTGELPHISKAAEPAPRAAVAGNAEQMSGLAPHVPQPANAPPSPVDQPSPETKHFYVSSQEGTKHHLVAGPYGSHDEAKAMQPHVQRHAEQHQPERAHFMAWGTSGSATPLKTPLGENWKPIAESTPTKQSDDAHFSAASPAVMSGPKVDNMPVSIKQGRSGALTSLEITAPSPEIFDRMHAAVKEIYGRSSHLGGDTLRIYCNGREASRIVARIVEFNRGNEQTAVSASAASPDKGWAHRVLLPDGMAADPEHITGDGEVLRHSGYGRSFLINEDHPSIYGEHLLGHEGEYGRFAYYAS